MQNEGTNQVLKRPIQILPPQLANQIAAGEVVERPASVVKELVENSLDAGATEILIEIEQGGQKRILIRDNGSGIAKDQLVLALSRHATSKISNIDDLEHITSMGFRGEALASISSVSRLTLSSKPHEQTEAWQAKAQGQQMDVVIAPTAHPDGTSIDVKDLFFNTPARRKFLRTGKTEFQHIEQVVKRIALTRNDVQFVLSHNSKVCFRYTKTQDLSKRIEQVCGKNTLDNWTPVEYQYEGVRLFGWCSCLGEGEATRDKQYTFVNGRMMKDKLLAHAIRQVYEDTLAPQSFPAYVLYLSVPPEQIDVNVHPAKHEVRFHQSRQIHDLVFKAITHALGNFAVDHKDDEQVNHNYIHKLEQDDLTPVSLNDGKSSWERESSSPSISRISSGSKNSGRSNYRAYQSTHPTKNELHANHAFYQSVHETSTNLNEANKNAQTLLQKHEITNASFLFNKPYIVFSDSTVAGQLLVLHVQALLSQIIVDRIARSTISQALLMPVSISPNAHFSKALLEDFEALLIDIQYSKNKLILKRVPSELRHLPWASIFPAIDFTEEKSIEAKDKLIDEIAIHWLNSIDVDTQKVAAWLQETNENSLPSLLQTQGKRLSIETWMKNG